jgi:UDP-glucuronate 4-epimerase
MNVKRNILITGAAGFIGSHLSEKLLAEGHKITAIDNFDAFYSSDVKRKNILIALANTNYTFKELDITNDKDLESLDQQFDTIIHLAAKAGVLPSIKEPLKYTQTNIVGTQNLLEFAKQKSIKKFIFASSSSVYGVNKNVPWLESDNVLKPISPYAASKVSGELIGQVYTSLYQIQFLALRFFTVYGPRQRPDLAIHKFTKMIANEQPIPFYGDGSSKRDYTYVDDIVDGIIACLKYKSSLYEIINLGNSNPVSLIELVQTIEDIVEKKAIYNKFPAQMGDVPITYADINKAGNILGYQPSVKLNDGIKNFFEWLKMDLS